MNFIDDSDLEEDRLTLAEPESINRLADLLEKHIESLSAARGGLAEFLRQNFKMEDLLAIREPISKFDRIHTMSRMSNAVRVGYLRYFAGKPIRKIRAPQNSGEDRQDP